MTDRRREVIGALIGAAAAIGLLVYVAVSCAPTEPTARDGPRYDQMPDDGAPWEQFAPDSSAARRPVTQPIQVNPGGGQSPPYGGPPIICRVFVVINGDTVDVAPPNPECDP